MNDNELFELCREVYEKTGWDGTPNCYAYLKNPYVDVWAWEVIPLHEDNVDDVDEWHPLYTSDYLLEKLPTHDKNNVHANFGVSMLLASNPKKWGASWECDSGEYEMVHADTPLKALLKLTLALHEAGELI